MNPVQLLKEHIALRGHYQKTFVGESGEAVLQHLCKTCFVSESTFVAGEPHMTAMNEGSRRVVLAIMRQLNRPLDDLIKKLEQARKYEVTES